MREAINNKLEDISDKIPEVYKIERFLGLAFLFAFFWVSWPISLPVVLLAVGLILLNMDITVRARNNHKDIIMLKSQVNGFKKRMEINAKKAVKEELKDG